MDSIKLHLQTKVSVQQIVRSTAYHLGSSQVNGNWCSHPPFIHLREDKQDIDHFTTPFLITVFCSSLNPKSLPYQNSVTLLQFNHCVMRQVDFD